MPIPKTRAELIEQIESSWSKLDAEMDRFDGDLASRVCVDDWTVTQLIAVRAWWSERVVEWIEAGRRGEVPVTPAEGFKWTETPRLNDSIAREAEDRPFDAARDRLTAAYRCVIGTIDSLDDRELLEPGVFEWAGKWPISRWLSINTARQYTTARTYLRRVR